MILRTAIVASLSVVSSPMTAAFMVAGTSPAVKKYQYFHENDRLIRPISVGCAAALSSSEEDKTIDIPSFIVSPVLSQVYPALVAHNEKYGNPNIPLGNTDGKRCKTLRRLHFQNKLTEEEVALLSELGFRFNSFEDVYTECDFDEMLSKLLDYKEEFQTFQIPKKYEPDPELGAWVTMLRRLNNNDEFELPKTQIDKLDAVGFEWTSTRKCGSVFMKRYRETLAYLSKVADAGGDASELLHEDTDLMKWLDAQRQAYENGNLSESRAQYMDDLPGVDWRKPLLRA